MGMGTGVGEKSKDANFIFRPLLYSSIQWSNSKLQLQVSNLHPNPTTRQGGKAMEGSSSVSLMDWLLYEKIGSESNMVRPNVLADNASQRLCYNNREKAERQQLCCMNFWRILKHDILVENWEILLHVHILYVFPE
jgi:hypothetical protein